MPTPLFEKGRAKTGGRKPGVPNKESRNLREAAFLAAEKAGGGSLMDYLYKQAVENPTAYLAFLGRFIPQQLTDEAERPVTFTRVVRLVVDPKDTEHPTIEIEARRDN